MIALSRSDLMDFARVVVLANTPRSLFAGMADCSGMDKLRKCSSDELIEYYDHITARAGRRNELVAGLAYAVLCAIVLQRRDTPTLRVDPARLQWGQRIWDFMDRANIGTQRIVIPATEFAVAPKVAVVSSASVDTRVALYGADGQPMPGRNPL